MPGTFDVTGPEFEREVLQSEVPVVVDFWADWCKPCKVIAPVLEELANEYAGKVKIARLNADENRATALRFGVKSLPSQVIFANGGEVDRVSGAVTKSDLQKRIEQAV